MISTIGHVSLGVAILVAAAGVLASTAAVRFGSAAWLRAARGAVALVALCLTVASGALVVALLRSDFRFEYVVGYTERALPFGYKLAAFWAGQSGSLLLWGWLLSVLCVIALLGFRRLTAVENAVTAAVLSVVTGFFAALLLFAANPFALVTGPVPADGRGLNPMLQDPGMIAHPPLLFLGYAACTIPFAVLVAVLVAKRSDNHWLADIRRWLVTAWILLTAGIVLGAWWAYVELGWGGYWAWDPVENASLLPWFTATALLHSLMVQQHRGMFKRWNAVLIALTFILCIFGTYLTRSGVVSSVHAFAPSLIGTFFLVFLVLLTVGSAGLIAWRHKILRPEHELDGLVSREGAFLLANALLLVMMLTTLVGTTFPILSGAVTQPPITVGPAFYNKVVAPMGLLLVAIMTLGPVLAFGRSAASRIAHSLLVPAVIAVLVTVGAGVLWTWNPWALVCVALTALGTGAVVVGFGRSVSARHRSTGEGWVMAAVRLVDRDHRRYGGQLCHLGMMMIVIGVAGSSLFAVEKTLRLAAGEQVAVGDYTLTYVALDERRAANYTAVQATVTLTDRRGRTVTFEPQRRFYDTWSQPNTEVSVRSTWREDLYVSLAGWEAGGKTVAIEVRVNPLVLWIWIGGIVMTLAALFCLLPPLLPRRVRATADAPRTVPTTPAVRPALRSPNLRPEPLR